VSDDIRAIERIVLSYATFADGGEPDRIVGLFADDGEVHAMGRTFAGERLAKFYGAAPRDVHKTKHMLSNIVVDVDGNDEASAVTYFQVLNTTGLQAWGRYIDQLRKIDGAWKIAVREVAVDGPVTPE
jgi:hypothetical protein